MTTSEQKSETNDIYNEMSNTDEDRVKGFYGTTTEHIDLPESIQKKAETEKKVSEIINKNKNKLYICEKCKTFPIIRIIGNKIKITCKDTKHEEEMEIRKYIQNITKNEVDEKNVEEIKKYKFCKTHIEKPIIKACVNCKQNLCEECLKNHENHKIKEFKELDEEIEYLKKQLLEYINSNYSNDKNEGNNSYKHSNLESAFKSADNKDKSSGSNTNFEQGLEESDILIDSIIYLISNMTDFPSYSHYENVKYFCSLIGERLELSYNMKNNTNNNTNNKEPNLKIRLLGKEFVENNKENCSLIINGEIEQLKEEYQLTDKDKDKDKLNIILLKEKDVTNMSYMFYDCENLVSISDNSKWKTDNVTDLSYMFYNCASLEDLTKQLKNLVTSKVKDMTYMLYGCKLLNNLDVSKWNTSNVEDMGYLFNRCENLKQISGISKWDTKNVDNMCFLFADCSSLQELRDIFIWNTSNVTDMSYMFCDCKSLKFITNDSKGTWNTKKVTNMSNMFNGCENIEAFPDNIFKWDTSKVQYMSCMFCNCKSLKSISEDIEKWDMQNVLHMNNMFENCSSLEKLPGGIIDWKIEKLVDIYEMIEGCDSLEDKDLPDFSKWKDKKIVYKGGKRFDKIFKAKVDN